MPDGRGEEVRGLRSTNRLLQSSCGDVKYSVGNGASKELTYTHDPWTWTMVWGLPEGVGFWVEGGKGRKIRITVIT